MVNPNKLVKDVLKGADNLFTSQDEYNKESTERVRIDTTSPFKLPHLIRPALGIWVSALYTVVVAWGLITGQLSFTEALESTRNLVGAVFLFYFGSRGFEKVFEQIGKAKAKTALEQSRAEISKSEAAVEIEELRVEATLKEEEKESNHRRKMERKAERRAKRND